MSNGLEFNTPIQFVPGVGAPRAAMFERLGIRKAIDLLFHFPRSYQEVSECKSIMELQEGVLATVVGVVVDIDSRFSFDGKSSVGVLLAVDGGGYVRCTWYNQPFRREAYTRGQRVLARGVVKSTGVAYQMSHPEVTILDADEPPPPPRPRAVYPLTEGLTQRAVSSAIEAALPLAQNIEEALSDEIRQDAATALKPGSEPLLPIGQALRQLHQPIDMAQADAARLRFVFQEFFVLQLALAKHRYAYQHERPAPSIETNAMIHARILKRFPFALTDDQRKVIDEVRADMVKTIPMNRLLQGDVGTGKTAIAQYAMLSAVASQHQAVLMAPTELLARQHARTLQGQLAGSRVEIALLVSSMPGAEKRELLQRIAIGTVDIVVGTQALLSEQVEFAKLGVVVIDEQHRFGVQQRATLRTTRTAPHYLVMTATPIPRTLALTLFGDLDVSTLKQRPPGQSAVQTYVLAPELMERWWGFIKQQVQAGRQAYVVAPRVESDDEKEIRGAVQWWEDLRNGPLLGLRVELLHGRMDSQQKQSVLERFAEGTIDVLVASTVIEVGIDVPNAAVMTIADADRLGLAQLHQLRGRVGRGKHAGYVGLIPSVSSQEDVPQSDPEKIQWLEQFAKIQDGFELAEIDLRRRGPGEIIGTKQTGLPEFRIADISKDERVLILAKNLAAQVIAKDPELQSPEHARLLRQVVAKHG
ncbi:MAG: ATP-dependent DNA helicase RecG, partial [Pirellula sp.]